jgi:hypothetical protein
MTDAKPPRRRRATGKDAPRLRQGVMKRGNTWSYVIRVKDLETGVSKPRWVGGFRYRGSGQGCPRREPGEGPEG